MRQIKSELKDRIDQVLNSLSYPQKDYTLTPPKNIQYGDLSTNIALVLAQDLKTSPMDIAKIFVNEIVKYDIDNIINISIHKPGFINFEISKNYFQSQISKIIKLSIKYGKGSIGAGKSANVEFVSANPTGPLTIGHGRNAILGDVVSNILKWQGYDVTREYYFNDAGRQMRILAKSVEALYFKLLGENIQIPEDGYQGDYLKDIAKVIVNEDGRNLEKGSNVFKEKTEKIIFHEIKQSLKNLGVKFDQFINEKTFYENGDIKNLLENLRKKDLIYEKDNATWFKTSVLGKKQDRVYIKSSGEPTYRVPDTAYHINKVKRKYDLIIDVFGADHADTYPDVILALQSLNYKTEHIKVLIYQFVTLLQNGKKIKMSTRKADFVTLDELVNEVGSDVVRYFFLMRSMNTHLDFDLNLAKDQSDKNPVFYLQYAYARICNIIKRANNLELSEQNNYDTSILNNENEILLIKYLSRFPEFIDHAYENLEPQIITNYLQQLSAYFHKFYSQCRVISDNHNTTQARIALVKAVKIILGNGFNILGISAPERM
tara:strand:+ start:3873 stop:5507 length:1635 start_codon:yes stop_codon:yes gene_type:complete